MRRLGMVGISFRRSSQEELAGFTFAPDEMPAREASLHEACGFLECVYLATCNRVEIVFVCRPGVTVSEYRRRIFRHFLRPETTGLSPELENEADRALHAYEGEGAAEHLFCVTASIDSMNPGESQIIGQVREGFSRGKQAGRVGPRLTLVFDEAFRAARRVRSKSGLSVDGTSMVSLVTDVMEEKLASSPGSLVMIGVGDMIRQCARKFCQRRGVSLLFVNRTLSRAEELAKEYGGVASSLETFQKSPPQCSVILTSTGAPEPVLGEVLSRFREHETLPLIIDLAIPRDTEVKAAEALGIELYDIDRIEGLASTQRIAKRERIGKARQVVDHSLETLRWKMVDREVGPVIGALQKKYRETVEDQVKRLAKIEDPERLTEWARGLACRFAHIPVLGLKRVAFDHGFEAVESFLAGLDGELGEDLRTSWTDDGFHPVSVDPEERT